MWLRTQTNKPEEALVNLEHVTCIYARNNQVKADAAPGGFGIDRGTQGDAGHATQRDTVGRVADAECSERGQESSRGNGKQHRAECERKATSGFADGSPWADCDWLPCRDGKARPVEPGTFPLVTRLSPAMGWLRPGEDSPYRTITDPQTGKAIGQSPWRVGMLRGYGNAIVPQVAAQVIAAYMEIAASSGED